MAGAASAHQAAIASREGNCQQRSGRTRRTSADPQRAQQGATAAAADAPAALQALSRLQQLADASPQVAQLRRLQGLADNRFAPVAQLAGGPEEEELVQGKFAIAELQTQPKQAPHVNNTGLPDQLKSGIESLSGLSMDHVRVHYNSSQPAQLNALAYAQGSDIHLAPGQERHLPHEAWHVVQQEQGRVQPTMQMKEGAPVNDDPGLEHEADVMGAKAVAITQQVTDPAAMENIPASDLSPVQQVAQRMTLNGEFVDEATPYPNDNEAAVLRHMAGEWDVANAPAVTGGHLLAAMVARWGAAVPNSANPNAGSPTGVHFTGGLPGNNITPHQHTFRLVAANPARQGQTKISNPKESTFWPANWSAANLAHTLNNSYQNGRANEWASKARMTYWYRWQTLGDNTLFPIERVAEPLGTLRNRMKAGRQAAQMRAASEPNLNGAGPSDHTQLVQRRASPSGFSTITSRQGVVQRHISWDAANNQFVIDIFRPAWMGTVFGMPVGMLQSKNHIIPFAGIQNDLCILLNQLLDDHAYQNEAYQNEVIALCESLYPNQRTPDYEEMVNRRNTCINAIINGTSSEYHESSRALLSALNSSPDNIRAGNAFTNLSIGENLDADFNAGSVVYNGNVIQNGNVVAINQNVLTLVPDSNAIVYNYFHQQENSAAIRGGFSLSFVLSELTRRQISSVTGPTVGGGILGAAALPVLVTDPAKQADPYLFQ